AAVATPADLGLLADGLIALAVATGEAAGAVTGRELLDDVLRRGADGDPVLRAHGVVAAPDQPGGDLPSAVSALAATALTAWRLGAGESYRAAAEERVRMHAASALQHPIGHGSLLGVAAGLADPPWQLVVVTEDLGGALAA